MSLLADIGAAYQRPRREMTHQVSIMTEPRILMLGFTACLLNYVSRMPDLAAISFLAEDDPAIMRARFATLFVSSVIMGPLFLYIIAALSHLVLRVFGGQATWQEARLALMWAALVASPLVLISGASKVFAPPSVFMVATLLTAVVFCWQWALCLATVEFPRRVTA
ncbi:YIP1 family protein [Neptunicoccus cionae]|uniref:Yip1 domain-containing protein n=1 Tax=Neptunicoccus cionae TaxID=2035344 RepID=A0A916QTB2_9RHOB|nr:YIP1 family protein [Amylibacter cionae]GGA11844.1 hypothetical protein GCM10011498_10060 [Amylibacter cionae]